MSVKYSPSTGGIYPTNVYKEFPADAIDIPDELYLKFKSGEISRFNVVNGQIVGHVESPSDAVLSCTPYQFHEALNLMGLTDAVNAAAAQNRSIQNAMQFAPEFKRNHPKIAEMAQAIGKTDADIDALFALAVTLAP
jgi:hypothetical protein